VLEFLCTKAASGDSAAQNNPRRRLNAESVQRKDPLRQLCSLQVESDCAGRQPLAQVDIGARQDTRGKEDGSERAACLHERAEWPARGQLATIRGRQQKLEGPLPSTCPRVGGPGAGEAGGDAASGGQAASQPGVPLASGPAVFTCLIDMIGY